MGVVPVQIHVMSAIDGVTWDRVWQSRQPGPLGRHAVQFIGRDAFLDNKRAAGRPKDLADIEALKGPRGRARRRVPRTTRRKPVEKRRPRK